MYWPKYRETDLARILGRTDRSLGFDIRRGRLRGRCHGHRYDVSLRELERYLGAGRARRLFTYEDTAADRDLPGNATMKRCRSCNRDLPVSEFPRDSMYPDGHKLDCRGCIQRDIIRFQARFSRRN